MDTDILEKTFGKKITRKVVHAKKFVKPDDSILEFSIGAAAGNFSGFLNTLLDDKTKHSVIVEFKDVDECQQIKDLSKSSFSILTPRSKVEEEYTAVFLTDETQQNLEAFYLHLQSNTDVRLVVWQWKHENEYKKIHVDLHALLTSRGLHPHVVGYENVYVRDQVPEEVKTIGNPPLPTFSSSIYSVLIILVFTFIVYNLSSYFFRSTTPIIKSLANKPI
jgi:hypothetical protein